MRNKGENICPVCGSNAYYLFVPCQYKNKKGNKYRRFKDEYHCYNCNFCYISSDKLQTSSEEEKAYSYIRRLETEKDRLDAIIKSYYLAKKNVKKG